MTNMYIYGYYSHFVDTVIMVCVDNTLIKDCIDIQYFN